MTMGFVTKYGSLFVPVIYWLVYLAARFIYNGLAGEYTPDFIQSISHDGVFIICSLLVFYLACLRIKDSGSEISAVLFWSVVGFHVAALVITFLICLWKGRFCGTLFSSGNWGPPCYCCFYACLPSPAVIKPLMLIFSR